MIFWCEGLQGRWDELTISLLHQRPSHAQYVCVGPMLLGQVETSADQAAVAFEVALGGDDAVDVGGEGAFCSKLRFNYRR